jgi:hypothetical protein
MRALLAFILGIVVTVGAAFVHDTMIASGQANPLVYWGNLHSSAQTLADTVRNQFSKK